MWGDGHSYALVDFMKKTKLFILSLAVVLTASIGFAALPAKPAAAFALPEGTTTFAQAAAEDTKKDEGFDKVCEEKSALGWLICPIINGMNEGIQALYGFILDRLQFSLLEPVSNDQSGKSGLNEASFNALRSSWQIMARIATGLLVMIFMVMLIAQAMSFSFVSAYTAKSLIPRIVIAILLIATSPYWMPAGME